MIRLVEPCEKYLKSYKDAYDEYSVHGVKTYFFDDARAYDIFEKYDNYRNERNLKPNRVGADYYWLVDDERDYFIGEISIRHKLTEALEQYGGHIGYGVRYSEWNKGYGTQMLKLALEKAQQRGLNIILITCDDDNLGSARVMEHNGLVLRDKVRNVIDGQEIITRRYELDLSIKLYEAELTDKLLTTLIAMSAAWEAENSTHGYRTNDRSDIEENRIFLAERNGEVLGYLFGHKTAAERTNSIMEEGTAFFEIEELYVTPEHRSEGIGKKLFAYAEQTVQAEGISYLMLSTATKDCKRILHFYLDELGMDFWSARLYKKL